MSLITRLSDYLSSSVAEIGDEKPTIRSVLPDGSKLQLLRASAPDTALGLHDTNQKIESALAICACRVRVFRPAVAPNCEIVGTEFPQKSIFDRLY